jgi:iron(III) transport system ATP-binding protein
MARALVVQPRLLLLDEPLSNLDAALRQELREEIRRIQRSTGVTTIYVTHDQSEALALADRLAVMHQGRIVQVGTPRELYQQPQSRFVALFLGGGNILPCRFRSQAETHCLIETPLGVWRVAGHPPRPLSPGDTLHCLVRAEHWQPAGDGAVNAFPATIKRVEFHGDSLQVELAAGETALSWRVFSNLWPQLTTGHTLQLSAPPETIVLLTD